MLHATVKIQLWMHLICRKNLYSRGINPQPFSLPAPVITEKHIFSRRRQRYQFVCETGHTE